MTKNQINPYQWRKLKRLLTCCKSENKFYQKKFSNYTIQNLLKKNDTELFFGLPFTTKSELLIDQEKHPPYGSNASLKSTKYELIRTTSGTTGNILIVPLSKRDLLLSSEISALIQKQLGMKKGDVLFDFHPSGSFTTILTAALKNKLSVIPWNQHPLDRTIDLINQTPANVLWSQGNMLLNLVNTIDQNKVRMKKNKIKLVVASGEIITPSRVTRIKKTFNAICRQMYGCTEAVSLGYNCPYEKCDVIYHHIDETSILEVIDPKTKEHEAKGELVITNLDRFDYPFIRYRMGELVEMVEVKGCPHKNKVHFKVIGRLDNQIRFQARFIIPEEIERTVQSIDGINDYRIEARRLNNLDFLFIYIKPDFPLNPDIVRSVQEIIEQKFGTKPAIEIVPFIPANPNITGKSSRFIDLRKAPIFSKKEKETIDYYFRRIFNILNYRFMQPLVKIFFGS